MSTYLFLQNSAHQMLTDSQSSHWISFFVRKGVSSNLNLFFCKTVHTKCSLIHKVHIGCRFDAWRVARVGYHVPITGNCPRAAASPLPLPCRARTNTRRCWRPRESHRAGPGWTTASRYGAIAATSSARASSSRSLSSDSSPSSWCDARIGYNLHPRFSDPASASR